MKSSLRTSVTLALALVGGCSQSGVPSTLPAPNAPSSAAISHATPTWGTGTQIVGVGTSNASANNSEVVQYAQCNKKIYVYPNSNVPCSSNIEPPPIQRTADTSIGASKHYDDCLFQHGDGSCAFRSNVKSTMGAIYGSSWVESAPPAETGTQSGEINVVTGLFQDEVTPTGSPNGGLAKISTSIDVSVNPAGFSCKAWTAAAGGWPTVLTAQATFTTAIGLSDTLTIVGSCPEATSPLTLTSSYTAIDVTTQVKTTTASSLTIDETWANGSQPVIGKAQPLAVSLQIFPNLVAATAKEGLKHSALTATLKFGMKSLEPAVKLKTASGAKY